jgi:hypothetical protein
MIRSIRPYDDKRAGEARVVMVGASTAFTIPRMRLPRLEDDEGSGRPGRGLTKAVTPTDYNLVFQRFS